MSRKKAIVIPTLVLTLICLVVAAALSVTNYYTKDIIAAAEKRATDEAMAALLPDCEFVSTEIQDAYIAQTPDGLLTGYLFITEAMGYKSKIRVMTATDPGGMVLGVKVIACSDESPGIGQKVADDTDFLRQFIGREITGRPVDAITGATYSSKGVAKAVDLALERYAALIALPEPTVTPTDPTGGETA